MGSTATFQSNGVVDFGSQPSICLVASNSRGITASQTNMFWDSADFQQNMTWVVSSSATITIPVGAGGIYHASTQITLTKSATGTYTEMDILKNGTRFCTIVEDWQTLTGINSSFSCERDQSFAAGDTVTVQIGSDNGVKTTTADAASNHFCLRKY